MIRGASKKDLNDIMDIWLTGNINAHCFVSKDYWIDKYEMVRDAISTANLKVFEDEGIIKGFVGLTEDYIAGIFVKEEYQSKGIGKRLLDECKKCHTNLTLDVYVENKKAVKFYKSNSFKIIEGMQYIVECVSSLLVTDIRRHGVGKSQSFFCGKIAR